jgi:carbonic anhydrase
MRRAVDEQTHGERRAFLRLAALGATAAVGGMVMRPLPGGAAETEILLLSCMDYRLVDEVTRYMDSRGLTNKYDQVILAGAALGATTEKYPAWGQTFWEHLDVAMTLHKIKKVMVINHRDCGAFKVILGKDLAKDPTAETAIHAEVLQRLSGAIRQKHPNLEVELLLMALDGKVETIG